jgi:hypothetical protein
MSPATLSPADLDLIARYKAINAAATGASSMKQARKLTA